MRLLAIGGMGTSIIGVAAIVWFGTRLACELGPWPGAVACDASRSSAMVVDDVLHACSVGAMDSLASTPAVRDAVIPDSDTSTGQESASPIAVLRVRVIDAETGLPLEAARPGWWHAYGNAEPATPESGGLFVIPVPDEMEASLCVRCDEHRDAVVEAGPLRARIGTNADPLIIPLTPYVTIRVRVEYEDETDAEDVFAAGVELESAWWRDVPADLPFPTGAWPAALVSSEDEATECGGCFANDDEESAPKQPVAPRPLKRAPRAADGSFLATRLPAGARVTHVWIRRATHRVLVPVEGDAIVRSGAIVRARLPHGTGSVAGTIVVRGTKRDRGMLELTSTSGTTYQMEFAQAGPYGFGGVAPGRYAGHCRAERGPRQAFELDVRSGEVVRLDPSLEFDAHAVGGVLHDEVTGRPVPFTAVALQEIEFVERGFVVVATYPGSTDAAGRFAFRGAEARGLPCLISRGQDASWNELRWGDENQFAWD